MKTKFFYQECIRAFGAKTVAQILGVSDATVYKYGEGKEFDSDSGCKNPIDYLLKLCDFAKETGNHRIAAILKELLCEHGHITHAEPTIDILVELSEAQAKTFLAYADGREDSIITPEEAKRMLDCIGNSRAVLDKVEAIAKEVLG